MSNNMYDILGKLKAVSNTAALTPETTQLTESAQPKGKLAETISKLESQYAAIKESVENDKYYVVSSQGIEAGPFDTKDAAKASKEGQREYNQVRLGRNIPKDLRESDESTKLTASQCAKLNKIKGGQSLNLAAWAAKVLERGTITAKEVEKLGRLLNEGRIDDLRDEQADKDDWFSDKKDKESNKRTVQGKNYGGSKAKDDEEKDELDESIDAEIAKHKKHIEDISKKVLTGKNTASAVSQRKKLIKPHQDAIKKLQKQKAELNEGVWDKPEGTKEKSSTGGTTEKTKTGVKHTAKKYGGETDKDAKEQDLDEALIGRNSNMSRYTHPDIEAGQDDVALVYRLADEGGLAMEPGDITAAKRVGNEIWTVGPDRNEDTWLLAIFNIKHKDFNGVPEGEFATEEEAMQALNQAAGVNESAAPGQEEWIKKNKKNFIDQYGKEKGLEVLYATAWKRSKTNESVNVKLGKKALNESRIEEAQDTFSHILQRFPAEVKQFKDGGELDSDLYEALFDYYFNAGEMPYGVAKARTGDPMNWVAQRLESDLGLDEGQFINPVAPAAPAPGAASTLETQLDEIARLAGLETSKVVDEVEGDSASPVGNANEDSFTRLVAKHRADVERYLQTGEITSNLEADLHYRYYDQLSYQAQTDADDDGEVEDLFREELWNHNMIDTLNEDINISINATGEDDALNLVRKLAGMPTVTEPVETEVEVAEERDIEYTNTPNEKIAPVGAAIPSGTDLNRSKKQDPRTANKAANPLAVKEEKETNKLWHKYADMLKGLLK